MQTAECGAGERRTTKTTVCGGGGGMMPSTAKGWANHMLAPAKPGTTRTRGMHGMDAAVQYIQYERLAGNYTPVARNETHPSSTNI